MKLTWKTTNNSSKKRPQAAISKSLNLPFELENEEEDDKGSQKDKEVNDSELKSMDAEIKDCKQLAESFQDQGNKLAEGGKFREALGKWETALTLMPQNAVLHEQKAQVLLEIGDAWNALKAATRATDLDPTWAEAWMTLGRAQLNFGEPDSAIESFDKALAIKPHSKDARDDRQTALHLVKRRKQFHSDGLNTSENRYQVGEKTETPEGT